MITVQQLDNKQLTILKQFADKVKDCNLGQKGDEYLLKWLLARNFDVDQAEKMLRRSLDWRKVNRIEEILEIWQPPEVLTKYYSMGVCGHDKQGCPLWISAYGNTDLKGILLSIQKKDFARYFAYIAEKSTAIMKKNSEISGKSISYQTVIFDMENLSARQMAFRPVREIGIELIKQMEANYPENLRRVYIINAPKVFTFIFSMIKPLMALATVDKIRVFGSERDQWVATLLEDIDADQLPAYYGGSLVDPDGDPKCPSMFNMGGIVPQSCYLSYTKPVPKDNMEVTTIPSGNKKKLKLKIEHVNSVLRWEFFTEDSDIGFHVYYKKAGEKFDIFPNERVESHLIIEEGEVVCTHQCSYVIEFDNTYSYLRSKKLWYRITLDDPLPSGVYEEFATL